MSENLIGKKEKTHKLLTNTAIKLFIKKKSSNVSLDEVADTADVARRTLYYHFNNKETLILEITEPIFFDGLDFLEEVGLKEKIGIDDIINLCIFLWEKYGLSLNLLYNIEFEDFHSLENLHRRYLNKYLEIFNRISDLPHDLEDYKIDIASLIFRCFVLILSKVEKMENPELRFRNSINGMIKGMSISNSDLL
jgi:AcrR family transcriptional regulator